MPPQGVLKEPVLALALLALQQLLVAKLLCADPQVAAHSQQVEPDLSSIVARDAALQHVDDLEGEVLGRAGPVGDWRRLEAVELVEDAVDWGVGDEVEDVLGGLAGAGCLVSKGAAAGEAVVDLADEVRVAKGLAAELWREDHCEVAKVVHLGPNVDVLRLVHEDAEQGLRRAGILDRLGGEEDGLGGIVVEAAVEGPVRRGIGPVGRVFEEEDYAVEGLEGEELRGVEGEELFELDVFDAEVFDEGCEDACIRLNRVPATAHDVTLCAVQTTARPSKWGIKLAMNQIIVAQPEFLEQIVQVMAVFVVVGTRQFSL